MDEKAYRLKIRQHLCEKLILPLTNEHLKMEMKNALDSYNKEYDEKNAMEPNHISISKKHIQSRHIGNGDKEEIIQNSIPTFEDQKGVTEISQQDNMLSNRTFIVSNRPKKSMRELREADKSQTALQEQLTKAIEVLQQKLNGNGSDKNDISQNPYSTEGSSSTFPLKRCRKAMVITKPEEEKETAMMNMLNTLTVSPIFSKSQKFFVKKLEAQKSVIDDVMQLPQQLLEVCNDNQRKND